MAKIIKMLALSLMLFKGALPCDRYIDIDRFKTDFEYYLMMSEWGGLTPLRCKDAQGIIDRYGKFFGDLCDSCKHHCDRVCKGPMRRLKMHLRRFKNNITYL